MSKGEGSTLKVAFHGEEGAYSQAAVYSFFGKGVDVVPCRSFAQVFSTVCAGADYGVVPIENSTAGTVGEILDLLRSSPAVIVGEVVAPIHHALLIHPSSSLLDIKRVLSHPQALMQCAAYLESGDRQKWRQVSVYDTAGAAKMIRDEGLRDAAAIAGELAGEIYNLSLVDRQIEDDRSNTTRFVVITARSGGERGTETAADRPLSSYKTSLIFSLQHIPGSLVEALSSISSRGLNLLKVESRPIRSRPWEYYFYVDVEGNLAKDQSLKAALAELGSKTVELKLLGSYPNRSLE